MRGSQKKKNNCNEHVGPGSWLRKEDRRKITTHLIKFILASLGVVDGWLIAVLEEVSCSDEPITTWLRCQLHSSRSDDRNEKKSTDHCSQDRKLPGLYVRCWEVEHGRLKESKSIVIKSALCHKSEEPHQPEKPRDQPIP